MLLIKSDSKEIEYPEIKDYPKVDSPRIGWHTWGVGSISLFRKVGKIGKTLINKGLREKTAFKDSLY